MHSVSKEELDQCPLVQYARDMSIMGSYLVMLTLIHNESIKEDIRIKLDGIQSKYPKLKFWFELSR